MNSCIVKTYTEVNIPHMLGETGDGCNTFCLSSYNLQNICDSALKFWHNVPSFVFYK